MLKDMKRRHLLARKVNVLLALFAILSLPFHITRILITILDESDVLQWCTFVAWYANLSYFLFNPIYETCMKHLFDNRR
jgi:hypothetical protein